MWHGPALADLLARTTALGAAATPPGGGHSIWELVLHCTAWATIARARLEGRDVGGDPTEDADWPHVPARQTPAQWRAAQDALRAAYHALAASTRAQSPAQLLARIPGREYNAATMLDGVIEHGTYHGGQIALLLRQAGEAQA
jgi:uncharacterized damage-inducible protein DinB